MNSGGWYLLKTKPKQEARAKLNLENQGFTAYVPTFKPIRLVRGKRIQRLEPLFPTYIFVKVDEDAAHFHRIRNTFGVSHFVRFGTHLAQISGEQLEAISKSEAVLNGERSGDTLQVGSAVEISNGPFAGVTARIIELKGEERCVVMLAWLNREIRAEFNSNELK